MGSSKLRAAIRSLFVSYLLAAALLGILAFLLYKFHLKESQVGLAVSGIYVISCFLCGLLMGKAVRRRRFFWGFAAGVLYFAVLLAASCLLGKGFPADTGQLVRTFIMCAASSTIGGMLS